jgi:hypothetical protein
VCGKYAGKTRRKMWRIPRIFARYLGIWTGIFFCIFFTNTACQQEIIETQSTLIKKKTKFSLYIYKEIQKGAVAKSYMTDGLLIYD